MPAWRLVASVWDRVGVFRARKRAHSVDQRIQRKADPRHDDRPCFDTPMSMDSFFEWCDFEKSVKINYLGLRNSTFNADHLGDGANGLGVLGGIALRCPELVEVVVGGHNLRGGRFFGRAQGTLYCIELCTRDGSAAGGAEN
jgi:hypothetical protein